MNEASGKYVINPQGLRKLDFEARTAIEDVNDQLEITSYFS